MSAYSIRRFGRRTGGIRGFTLIELLVVIAIIAILAAILFPVFSRARARARAASCLSNQKQWGTAILQYLQDFDECYPANGYYTPALVWWFDILAPYSGTKVVSGSNDYAKGNKSSIAVCPDGPPVTGGTAGSYGNLTHAGYAANAQLLGWYLSPGIPLAAVNNPAALFLILETGYPAWNSFGLRGFITSGGASSYAMYCPGSGEIYGNDICRMHTGSYAPVKKDCLSGRHFGGMNIVYADGHVKWVKAQVVIADALDVSSSTNGGPGWDYMYPRK
ncbi:MAG: prepilin-type N-terminal cleavage/methylation domain-containing protein [Armatimonadetes bacterium]|nr:prepilin-type N-terminal cleavage/methylation domain-containing protein [Armatimonadota bacterium]